MTAADSEANAEVVVGVAAVGALHPASPMHAIATASPMRTTDVFFGYRGNRLIGRPPGGFDSGRRKSLPLSIGRGVGYLDSTLLRDGRVVRQGRSPCSMGRLGWAFE
jgi:hypothetical protein